MFCFISLLAACFFILARKFLRCESNVDHYAGSLILTDVTNIQKGKSSALNNPLAGIPKNIAQCSRAHVLQPHAEVNG